MKKFRDLKMKIILTFFWIIIGGALLWFFAENLDQSVTIDVFGHTYEHINLVTVIFISTMLGLLLGAILMTWQVIKSKASLSSARRENKKLTKKVEELEEKIKQQANMLKTQKENDNNSESQDLATGNDV